jgi:hypothetical protein
MSQLNVDSIKDRTGANQPDIVGAAKAFVNFDGTGTVTIRNGFNVSSITDLGTGYYRINFATAMQDANYCAPISSTESATSTSQGVKEGHGKISNYLTTSCTVVTKFHVYNVAFRAHDSAVVSVAIFR